MTDAIPNKEMELKIISLFVEKDKKKRLSDFIELGKREKFISTLNTPDIFDKRYVTQYSGKERTAINLVQQYKKMGMGGRVYAISDNLDWDAQTFQMSYILDACLSACIDTLGYCWKTQTAFYEWHHSGESYFMTRGKHA